MYKLKTKKGHTHLRLFCHTRHLAYNESVPKASNFIYLIMFFLIILLVNGVRTLQETRQKIGRLDESKIKLEELKIENTELQAKLIEIETEEYIEKVAIEQLNMAKPGYRILALEPTISPTSSLNTQQEAETKEKSNWVLWKETFKL